MKRYFIIIVFISFLFPFSLYGFVNNITASVGEGVMWVKGSADRTPFNFELIPSYSFLIVKLDLGFLMNFEKKVDFMLRPGVRVCPPFLYVRGAIPLKLTHGFDYGFLLGVGKNILSLGVFSLFIEIDTFFTKKGGFDVVPIEGRLGIEVGF